VTGHRSIILNDNAVLTVNGELNAETSHASYGSIVLSGNGRILVASGNTLTTAATINGAGVIHLKSQGLLFQIESGKGLILDGAVLDGLMTAATATTNNITLPSGYADAQDNGQASLVGVANSALFWMKSGVIGYNAGLAGVDNAGNFVMDGGEIRGNCHNSISSPSKDGGGVYLSGTFTMNGGEIRDNRANNGGGVYIHITGSFTMAGGTVYGSSAGPGYANTAPSQGAALCAIFGTAKWGDNSTITNKSNQNGTISGGSPGSVVP
jgi:hypothetical protein